MLDADTLRKGVRRLRRALRTPPAAPQQARLEQALSTAAGPIATEVWQRYALYGADGNTVALLKALNDMYVRVERIDEKLSRLLGQQPEPATRTAGARLRRCVVPLPAPLDDPAAGGRELEVVAHTAMFVPRKLVEIGFRGYEPGSLPHFLAALDHAPRGAVLDIGLNVGPYALLARAFSDRTVVGFEPTPDLAAVARAAGRANDLAYDVEELAIGDEDGTATLYLSDSTDSSNSLNPEFRRNTKAVQVPLATLDTWLAGRELVPGIVKVDVESMEPSVLRGARASLARHKPWVFCEVLPGEAGGQIVAALDGLGYVAYHLDGPGPLAPRPRVEGHPEHFMWLFVPEPLGPEHWARAAAWREALDAGGGPGREELLPPGSELPAGSA